MKHLASLFALCTILAAHGQESQSVPQFAPNTEFALKITKTPEGYYDYGIESAEEILNPLSLEDPNPLREELIPEDEIRGQFRTVDTEQGPRTILSLKSGLPETLTLSILISFDGVTGSGVELDLYPNLLRNDYWSGSAHFLLLGGLCPMTPAPFPAFEPMRDSTCIKNQGLNEVQADKLLREQLLLIRNAADKGSDPQLPDMEQLERQAASRPVERSYTRGIGTSLYPNVRGYELEPRPKEYLRIECPHLSNNIIYFTEKGSDRICVMFWEWEGFQEIIAPFGNRFGEEQRKHAFRRKFETLRNLITGIMGQPQSVELESADLDPETDQFLDTITWHTGNGINISLLLKGDLVYQLRNMRMCIYRE